MTPDIIPCVPAQLEWFLWMGVYLLVAAVLLCWIEPLLHLFGVLAAASFFFFLCSLIIWALAGAPCV